MWKLTSKPFEVAGSLLLVVTLSACAPQSRSASEIADGQMASIANAPWPTQMFIPAITMSKPLDQQLDVNTLGRLARQAYAGDPISANILTRYYGSPGVNKHDESAMWLEIAAENGDPMAANELAAKFSELGGESNCLRAKFWGERALRLELESGAEVTPTNLTNLVVLADNWSQCVARGGDAIE